MGDLSRIETFLSNQSDSKKPTGTKALEDEDSDYLISSAEARNLIGLKRFEPYDDDDPSDPPRFTTFMVDIKDIVLIKNIRSFSEDFLVTLANSINKQGQLQPCIGYEKRMEDGSMRVVLIAGQHRYFAIRLINEYREEKGKEPKYVMVNVADRELNEGERIAIQLTENLQNDMTPAETAKAITELWFDMQRFYEKNGQKLTTTAFAAKIGRSPETVSKAVKYVGGVTPVVQDLVEKNLLPYGHAVLLAEIDDLITRGEESDITDEDRKWKQIDLAQHFITKKFNYKQASAHLKRLREENKFAGPLFGDEWELMEVKNRILAIKSTSDKQGKEAAVWFAKMVRTAEIIQNKTGSVKLSGAIHNALELLGVALDDFKRDIKPYLSEREFDKLFRE